MHSDPLNSPPLILTPEHLVCTSPRLVRQNHVFSASTPDPFFSRLVTTYGFDLANATSTIRYGLTQRCERSFVSIPGPSGRLEYSDYQCRPFPLGVQDGCDDENRISCAKWGSAQYFTELGIGFAAMALAALLIGASTHSRRRRVWRAVAGLVILHGRQPAVFSWSETNISQPSSNWSHSLL